MPICLIERGKIIIPKKARHPYENTFKIMRMKNYFAKIIAYDLAISFWDTMDTKKARRTLSMEFKMFVDFKTFVAVVCVRDLNTCLIEMFVLVNIFVLIAFKAFVAVVVRSGLRVLLSDTMGKKKTPPHEAFHFGVSLTDMTTIKNSLMRRRSLLFDSWCFLGSWFLLFSFLIISFHQNHLLCAH